jgi:hypothetical protein
MTEQKTQAAVTTAIGKEWDDWEELVGKISPERMLEPAFAGGWTFKDLIAHLNGWRSRSLDRIEAAERGQPDPPPPWPAELTDDDSINAWIHEQSQERLLMDVLTDASGSFARLRDAVEVLPEDELFDPKRFPWMDGTSLGDAIVSGDFFGHLHEEHLPDIRAWLART